MSRIFNAIKHILKNGGIQKTTGTEVISSVKPNVPKTKIEKTKSKLAIAKQKTKASQKINKKQKIRQCTIFRIKTWINKRK